MKAGVRAGAVPVRAIHALGVVACLAILGGAVASVVIPRARQSRAVETSVGLVAELDQRVANSVGVADGLQARLDALETSVESRQVRMLKFSDLNRRLAELNTLLEEHGLVVEMLQPASGHAAGPVRVTPIRIEVRGTLTAISTLLDSLQAEHPDLHVESIAIEFVGGQELRSRANLRWVALPG